MPMASTATVRSSGTAYSTACRSGSCSRRAEAGASVAPSRARGRANQVRLYFGRSLVPRGRVELAFELATRSKPVLAPIRERTAAVQPMLVSAHRDLHLGDFACTH